MASKLFVLVNKLMSRTKGDSIAWEKTAEDGVFQAAFPNYTIQLDSKPNRHNPDALDYVVRILDRDGTLLDEVSDVDFDVDYGMYEKMREMYTRARRRALGVDEAVDSLIASLDDIPSDDE